MMIRENQGTDSARHADQWTDGTCMILKHPQFRMTRVDGVTEVDLYQGMARL